MSPVFVDTSAFIALLVSDDAHHARATRAFEALAASESRLLTSSYVLVETYALLFRRVGIRAVRAFRDGFTPLLETAWVGAELHERGVERHLRARGRSRPSLVDAVSFELMMERSIDRAFAFDPDFERAGFRLFN